jgi:hypothetical protein
MCIFDVSPSILDRRKLKRKTKEEARQLKAKMDRALQTIRQMHVETRKHESQAKTTLAKATLELDADTVAVIKTHVGQCATLTTMCKHWLNKALPVTLDTHQSLDWRHQYLDRILSHTQGLEESAWKASGLAETKLAENRLMEITD